MITAGTLANVSTLLITVGLPQRPLCVGYGGRMRGCPRWPSIEWIRAVSSPQTKAPAPRRISRSNSNPEPRMLRPSRPQRRHCSMAISIRSIAMGYSART